MAVSLVKTYAPVENDSFDPDFGWLDEYDPWNPVEQGMYDDDPNPYHGDYSEW